MNSAASGLRSSVSGDGEGEEDGNREAINEAEIDEGDDDDDGEERESRDDESGTKG